MDMPTFIGMFATMGSTESNVLADLLLGMGSFATLGVLISVMGGAITHLPMSEEKNADRFDTEKIEIKKAA